MAMNGEEAELLKKLGIQLPPQPQTLMSLQRLLATEDYDLRAVAKTLAEDPAMAARVFRIARSPAFSRRVKITSLEQALMVVGIQQVLTLVKAESLAATLTLPQRKAFEVFWERARETAQLASIIAADRVSVCNIFPEQAYLSGIFYECGVPMLMLRFPEYCESLQLDSIACWPALADEDQRLGIDHCVVGYLLARHWGLPDFVCDAIRYHHEIPDERVIGASVTMVAIVQMASHCYHHLHHLPNPLWPKIGRRVMSELGLAIEEEGDYCEQMISCLLETV